MAAISVDEELHVVKFSLIDGESNETLSNIQSKWGLQMIYLDSATM